MLDTISVSGQTDLFGYSKNDEKSNALMKVMDQINNKYARVAIWLASVGTEKSNDWMMQRKFKGPNYTGDWTELLEVR